MIMIVIFMAYIGNGSTKFFCQHKNYSRCEKKISNKKIFRWKYMQIVTNDTTWLIKPLKGLHDNNQGVIFKIYSQWKKNTYILRNNQIIDGNPHDDVIKSKHFPRYWPFVRGIHRWPVNSPHKGQWRGALMFSLICASINGWVHTREAGDLRRHHAHYDVVVMTQNKNTRHPIIFLPQWLALWAKVSCLYHTDVKW